MKFGIVPINIGAASAEQMLTIAQTAEDAGYESVWTFEHVIVPVDYESKYPYADSGKIGCRARDTICRSLDRPDRHRGPDQDHPPRHRGQYRGSDQSPAAGETGRQP